MRAIKIKQAGGIGLIFLTSFYANAQAYPVAGESLAIKSIDSLVRASDEDLSFDNLDVVDPTLKGKLAVLRVGSEVGENKLLTVFAGLRNKTGRHLDLEIQTIYKDEFGNALNAGSWISFTLAAHEEREYHSSAISVQAVDFLVRVRHAAATSNHN